MNTARRLLRLDDERWDAVDADSFWSGAAIVIVTSFLLALTRFGGLAATEPRSLLRLALVGVWGWIGLATLVWIAGALSSAERPRRPHRSALRVFASVGIAHVPLLAFAGVLFVAAMLFRWLGAGTVTAWLVFAAWLPASLVIGARSTFGLATGRALAVAVVPYGVWYAIVGRHLLQQVGHLM